MLNGCKLCATGNLFEIATDVRRSAFEARDEQELFGEEGFIVRTNEMIDDVGEASDVAVQSAFPDGTRLTRSRFFGSNDFTYGTVRETFPVHRDSRIVHQ